jgi:hypothetical protein
MVLFSHKLQNSAFNLADPTRRGRTISTGDLQQIFLTIPIHVEPFEFFDRGVAIVTCVSGKGNGASQVLWQFAGAGALDAASTVGMTGGDAALPRDHIGKRRFGAGG